MEVNKNLDASLPDTIARPPLGSMHNGPYGTASCEEFIEKLERIAKDLQIRFVDHPELQKIELPDSRSIYFVSSELDHSENLPGGSCGENMRAAYPLKLDALLPRPLKPQLERLF